MCLRYVNTRCAAGSRNQPPPPPPPFSPRDAATRTTQGRGPPAAWFSISGGCGNTVMAEEILPVTALWANGKKVPQFGQFPVISEEILLVTGNWESDRFSTTEKWDLRF